MKITSLSLLCWTHKDASSLSPGYSPTGASYVFLSSPLLCWPPDLFLGSLLMLVFSKEFGEVFILEEYSDNENFSNSFLLWERDRVSLGSLCDLPKLQQKETKQALSASLCVACPAPIPHGPDRSWRDDGNVPIRGACSSSSAVFSWKKRASEFSMCCSVRSWARVAAPRFPSI